MAFTVPIRVIVESKKRAGSTRVVTMDPHRSSQPERQDAVRVLGVRGHVPSPNEGVRDTEGRDFPTRSAC